jgi:hypothetical protein
MATELGFDGGNVQIKVNQGEFEPIPAAAYVSNGPDTLATEPEGNTNPLAGQDGFTGTNPGHAFGSWGTSVVDLTAAGAESDSVVQLRFAIGRDGCGSGIEGSGWYVDNVRVDGCKGIWPARTETKAVKYLPKPVPVGHSFRVKVKVTADEIAGTPRGKVRIMKSGKAVGTATLKNGVAWVKVNRKFGPGKVSFSALYARTDKFKRSADRFTVRFVRR